MGNHLDANGIPGKLLPLVHPDSETIEIFDFAKRQDEPVSVVENGTHPAISTPLLPGLELLLSRVFRRKSGWQDVRFPIEPINRVIRPRAG